MAGAEPGRARELRREPRLRAASITVAPLIPVAARIERDASRSARQEGGRLGKARRDAAETVALPCRRPPSRRAILARRFSAPHTRERKTGRRRHRQIVSSEGPAPAAAAKAARPAHSQTVDGRRLRRCRRTAQDVPSKNSALRRDPAPAYRRRRRFSDPAAEPLLQPFRRDQKVRHARSAKARRMRRFCRPFFSIFVTATAPISPVERT